MYRQGDILIVRDPLPKGATQLNINVIAYGEATGHAHKIAEGGVLFDSRGDMHLVANDNCRLVHDEHATIVIPEGEYRVIRQREYDEKEFRYVND